MKKVIKKLLFWNGLSLESKQKIKKLFGKKTVSVKKAKPKAKSSSFNQLFNTFSVIKADLSHYEVALYFAGGVGNLYQVEQWIGAFNALNEKKRIVLIVRDKKVFEWLAKHSDFTVVYCLTIEDLTNFYEKNNIKCILYVNHGFKNFQSLIVGDALHVHINHGESDKTSTITNQSKAYDYIFIVSDAGYDKYKDNLIQVDMSKFIKIGRPQLDHIAQIEPFDTNYVPEIIEVETEGTDNEVPVNTVEILKETPSNNYLEMNDIDKKIILYAPTWEATHESMNFTSINDYGMTLVTSLLEDPNYYLVYKPHPNTGSRDSVVKQLDNQIQELIDNHPYGKVMLEGDINSIYEHVDLAIFDNSAVAIDYLNVNKPMLMTDLFYRINNRQSKPTIVKAARMLSKDDAHNILAIISEELELDTMHDARNRIKQYFLGNYEKGESSRMFVDKVVEICEERDQLLANLIEYNANKEEVHEG